MCLNKSNIIIYFIINILFINYETQAIFISPEEITSFLNVIYSNLFTFKKGVDSRIGFGFKLGEHTDVQILLELGPQKYTKPIGPPRAAYKTSLRQLYRNKLRAKILSKLSKKSTYEKLKQLVKNDIDVKNNTTELNNNIEN